jgi:hypothetical protein
MEWSKIRSKTGVCYTDPRKIRFRNAVPDCVHLRATAFRRLESRRYGQVWNAIS